MVGIWDIKDHYWFRTQIDANTKGDVFQGYLSPDDSWMDKYTVAGAQALRELVYLTQDVEEEDGPVPDFLLEDSDPQAISKWIAGTYVNPHQIPNLVPAASVNNEEAEDMKAEAAIEPNSKLSVVKRAFCKLAKLGLKKLLSNK
jgi:hypothetical protein